LKKKIVLVPPGPLDLVGDAERETITGLCLSAYTEQARKDLAPAGVDISAPGSKKRIVRWPRGELEQWVRDKIAKRDLALAQERERQRQDQELIENEKLHVAKRDQQEHVPATPEREAATADT
jgi:hypothetical protein